MIMIDKKTLTIIIFWSCMFYGYLPVFRSFNSLFSRTSVVQDSTVQLILYFQDYMVLVAQLEQQLRLVSYFRMF